MYNLVEQQSSPANQSHWFKSALSDFVSNAYRETLVSRETTE